MKEAVLADVLAELTGSDGCQLLVNGIKIAERMTKDGALTEAGEKALVRALQLLARSGSPPAEGFSIGAFWTETKNNSIRAVGGSAGMGPGKPSHAAWLTALSDLCMARSVELLMFQGIAFSVQDLDSFPRLFPLAKVRLGLPGDDQRSSASNAPAFPACTSSQ